MIQQILLDYGTLVAFGAIAIDLVFQIHRVWKRKSSRDISLFGYTVRFIAAFILLSKYASLSDEYLITGQMIVVVLHTVYFWLVIKYRYKKHDELTT